MSKWADATAKEREDAPADIFCGPDRSFPIADAADVERAIPLLNRTNHDPAPIKACIIRKAKANGWEDALPDTWKAEKRATMKSAIKLAGDDTLHILAIPFGGPIAGKDTDGEFFSKRTDLCLDWFPDQRPLLYDHGMDDGPGVSVVGRVQMKTLASDEDGHWVEAQLDRRSRYYTQIKKLIGHDALNGSTGALPHLVQTAKNGEILRWPWVEQSLTPIPANLYSRVSVAETVKRYKSAGIPLVTSPDVLTQVRKSFQLLPTGNGNGAGMKAGRVLSAANEEKVRNAIAELEAVLRALGMDTGDTSEKAAKMVADMSYSDLQAFLTSELQEDFGDMQGTGMCCYIRDLFDDRVIYCDDTGALIERPYAIVDGDAVWGPPQTVMAQTTYVPVTT